MTISIVERLRFDATRCELQFSKGVAGNISEAADEIVRLRNALRAPLSSAEMKLVDKHCDWEAFKHAWNAVLKSRLSEIDNR